VSQHLRVLREQGFATVRRRTRRLYRVGSQPLRTSTPGSTGSGPSGMTRSSEQWAPSHHCRRRGPCYSVIVVPWAERAATGGLIGDPDVGVARAGAERSAVIGREGHPRSSDDDRNIAVAPDHASPEMPRWRETSARPPYRTDQVGPGRNSALSMSTIRKSSVSSCANRPASPAISTSKKCCPAARGRSSLDHTNTTVAACVRDEP